MIAYTTNRPVRPLPEQPQSRFTSQVQADIRRMVASGLGWEDCYVKLVANKIYLDRQLVRSFVLRGRR